MKRVIYFRVLDSSLWIRKEKDGEIPGVAVISDCRCRNNEWSVYRVETDDYPNLSIPLLEKIVLRAAITMPRRSSSYCLCGVTETWLKKLKWEFSPDLCNDFSEAGKRHYEIEDVTLGKIDIFAKEMSSQLLDASSDLVYDYPIEDVRRIILKYQSEATSIILHHFSNVKDARNSLSILLPRGDAAHELFFHGVAAAFKNKGNA
jgi:hypothetical protein